MAEPRSNLYIPCKEHEHRPGVFIGQPREHFLDKTVKLRFRDPGMTDYEHMWVRVGSILGDEGELLGILVSDPVIARSWTHGDGIAFEVKEIEDVLYTASGPPDPAEKKGIEMIVFLQKYFSSVDEPEDRALEGWRNMSREEHKRVTAMYIRLSEMKNDSLVHQ